MRYDYECTECKAEKIVHRPMSEDDPGYTCDECNAPVKRVYTGPGGFIPSPGMYSYKGPN